jgi:cytochrome c-type biogenesis protein CcmF
VVHLGVVILCVGVAASSSYVVATSGTVAQGELLQVGSYQLRFTGMEEGREPHRAWVAAAFEITRGGGAGVILKPRQNFFARSTDPIGTPAVRSSLKEDLYLSLMAYDPTQRTATFRAWVFPLVAWMWCALPLIIAGAAIAAWPARRRVPVIREATATVATVTPKAGGAV